MLCYSLCVFLRRSRRQCCVLPRSSWLLMRIRHLALLFITHVVSLSFYFFSLVAFILFLCLLQQAHAIDEPNTSWLHMYTYIYIYIYICVCICICIPRFAWIREQLAEFPTSGFLPPDSSEEGLTLHARWLIFVLPLIYLRFTYLFHKSASSWCQWSLSLAKRIGLCEMAVAVVIMLVMG